MFLVFEALIRIGADRKPFGPIGGYRHKLRYTLDRGVYRDFDNHLVMYMEDHRVSGRFDSKYGEPE
jgi:hypothetical protein